MAAYYLHFEKSYDSYKMFHFFRNSYCRVANGIGIFNSILFIFYYAGIILNVQITIFASPFLQELDLIYKYGFLISYINLFLLLDYLIDINGIPEWFNDCSLFKRTFEKKFLIPSKIIFLIF